MSIQIPGERLVASTERPRSAATPAPRASTEPDQPSFATVLARVTKEFVRTDATIDAAQSHALHGGATSDLLMLQANVARAAEMVTVAAKLVDSVTNGVRTVLSKTE